MSTCLPHFFNFHAGFFVRETPSCEREIYLDGKRVLIYCRLKFAEIATAEAWEGGGGQLLILTSGRLI